MRRQDPFREMRERMQEMFNSFRDLEDELPRAEASVPVDIQEENGKIVVTADLPGVEKDQVNVEASEDSLDISASHDREVEEEQKNYYRRERSSRRYRRKVALPATVNPDSAEAEYENGVLTVELEKSEEEGKKEVEVS
ncbi:MAG: Hsp20/alpha crystallin family protein [Candidatus Nanohaloarchaea archaeon]|nr:Hsp20/alpha crystallin family protein [Candidatus Nanohaloarchaea archaeon]